MERKIEEIFEYNGEWYQCIKGSSCDKCDFLKSNCIDNPEIKCSYDDRKDGTSVVFKKLEKVGEPVTVKSRTFQKLTSDNNSCKECVFNVPNKACCKNSYIEGICDDNGFWVEIKQNKEDMEEKKIQHYDCFFDGKSSKSNLKPFDLKAAKAGKPVCTRDGRKARIICFDLKNDEYPIVAAVGNDSSETLFSYTTNGEIADGIESDKDLMMLPEKKEGWVNVYDADTTFYFVEGMVYDTKEEAIKHINHDNEIYTTTAKIEFEK